MITIGELLREATRRLGAAGADSPRLDARLLLAAALGTEDRLHGREDETVPHDAADRFAGLMRRREAREPVSRILGRREFWSLEFELGRETLDPRPDSETLIEALLDHRPDRSAPLRILDIGTGTGCLLLAALSEYPNAEGVGADIEQTCVEIAARNAQKLCLSVRARMIRSCWDESVKGPFDVVLSNPPYIPSCDLETLDPEVRNHDPARALDGGSDGLDPYRILAERLRFLLAEDGLAILEFGAGQDTAVAALMDAAGLSVLGFRADLGGRPRCILVAREATAGGCGTTEYGN